MGFFYRDTVITAMANRIGPISCISRPLFPYPQRRRATEAAMPETVSAGVMYSSCCQSEVSATISLSMAAIKRNGKATMAIR